MRRLAPACLTVLLILNVACGYIMAGTWEDDPRNWGRALQSTKPDDVLLVHSKYWRSPHWSYEFQYFLEIAPNAALQAQLFNENKLRKIADSESEAVRRDVFGDAPSWFAPKAVTEYDVWVFEKEPGRHFKVLIDKQSGEIFLSDFNV